MAEDLSRESQDSLRGATNLYRESQTDILFRSGCVKIIVDFCVAVKQAEELTIVLLIHFLYRTSIQDS